MQVTPEQARDIIINNDGDQNAHITSFSEIKSVSYRCASDNSHVVSAVNSHTRDRHIDTATPRPGRATTSRCPTLTEHISSWSLRSFPGVRRLPGRSHSPPCPPSFPRSSTTPQCQSHDPWHTTQAARENGPLAGSSFGSPLTRPHRWHPSATGSRPDNSRASS